MAVGRRDVRMTCWQGLVCGGLAGLSSRSATCPLDVVKVLSQVGTFHTKRGFLRTFQLLYEAEGLRAFWKGNCIACARLFPYSTVQLSAYNNAIVAGSLAGIVAAILTYPTEVIETRLIIQDSTDPTYRGITHTFHTIYSKEGFSALYRGASLTILGAIPFSAGSFLVYINLDNLWRKPSVKFTALQNFANGCLAAGVAQTLSFPFETVKRKMQAQSPLLPHYGGVDVHFTGIVECFKQIIKTKGILSLWNGLTANLIKIVPYYGLMFSIFEFCKRACLYKNGYIVSPLSYQLIPGVDQSLRPQELRSVIRGKNFETKNALGTNGGAEETDFEAQLKTVITSSTRIRLASCVCALTVHSSRWAYSDD
ncbi:solute carrier family 25 member 43 isoform X2 [Callorhinchus milii]|uniref:solute carrier family 25 member 43 isoform X2 n=1 Tax=Callorhinchus milii TaxID=7868 RepID=UPI001C3FA08E|nr:solute carrier family 25 member 43 isoform X2 [Callorhinchus milii]